MRYEVYQAQAELLAPTRALAGVAARILGALPPAIAGHIGVRSLTATYEMIARAGLTHQRPRFDVESVTVGRREVAVKELVTDATPFGSLVHFEKDMPNPGPRVVIVAPLSGHFTTLLRDTVRTLLVEHDVFLTDWHNARDIGVWHGRFGFDEYVEHVIRFLEVTGPGAHVVAVCQPCVPALAAAAVMADGGNEAQPRSLTLMAGPIDARVNPTRVNDFATSRPLGWFDRNVISTVPLGYPGVFRRVYPGFLQLTAFMSMNLRRHVGSHAQLFVDLVNGDEERAGATKAFYDEYFAVLDLPGEFYLETVDLVFQRFALAQGSLRYEGELVRPEAITRTSLLTIEGERDDICSVGQTLAAQDLCTGIRPSRKSHHLQPGVGHYGVFSGRRWNAQVAPVVRNVIHSSDARRRR
jgi:polyhydroxyalkanoate depolymerase